MEASTRTVVSPQRFSKRNMLRLLCGAVRCGSNAVAMQHKGTYLLAPTSGKTTARPPVFVCRSKQVVIMDLDVSVCDSDRIITEVQKRPALYDKAMPEYSDKHCKVKLWAEVCEAVVPNWSRMDTSARMSTGKK
jgi:hypothetical protein